MGDDRMACVVRWCVILAALLGASAVSAQTSDSAPDGQPPDQTAPQEAPPPQSPPSEPSAQPPVRRPMAPQAYGMPRGGGGLRGACGFDIERLCAGVPPGGGRIMQCLM